MKKVMYICLALIVLGGVGVGVWLLLSPNSDTKQTDTVTTEEGRDLSTQTSLEAVQSLKSINGLITYMSAKDQDLLSSGVHTVFFAPSIDAVKQFADANNNELPVRYMPYHVVTAEIAPEIKEGAKLKTSDGQEVIIVKTDGELYVRDAKGNDARLRKPYTTKNGAIYVIDKVLLTQ